MERIDKTLPVSPAPDATYHRFRHGQVIVGKIESIQEETQKGKTALVRVGEQLVAARLQTSLQAGDSYLFEVKNENGEIYWKPIAKQSKSHLPSSIQNDEAAQYLLQKWKLPKDLYPLLLFALAEKIPITKEELISIASLVETLEHKKEGLSVLGYMLAQRLPLTKDIFFSLLAVKTNPPLFQQLQYVESRLASLPPHQPEPVEALRRYIQQMFHTPAHAYESLVKLLQSLQQQEPNAALQLLNRLGVVSVSEIAADELAKLQAAMEKRDFAQVKQQLQLLFAPFDEQAFLERFQAAFVSYQAGLLPDEEQRLFSAALADTDIALSMFHLLKQSLLKLGFSDEAKIRRALKTNTFHEAAFSSLKSLLLQALEDVNDPVLKEQLQTLLHHINGQQLLSDIEGPIQHLFVQIPFQLGQQHTDVTIYWQGKREKDGKIDPNYCHIVFCLFLDHLKETVVDVRVQQRIVHISVFNPDPRLPELANALQPLLKERLAAHGYTLSALKVEAPAAKKTLMPIDAAFDKRYSEVDYRI
ncbi:ABC transporter substrate-binding protein [Parageobacillus genomosp. 1]|nr:ABC transporter substrate-binding protein [Parageobacillus genomosp. 1]